MYEIFLLKDNSKNDGKTENPIPMLSMDQAFSICCLNLSDNITASKVAPICSYMNKLSLQK